MEAAWTNLGFLGKARGEKQVWNGAQVSRTNLIRAPGPAKKSEVAIIIADAAEIHFFRWWWAKAAAELRVSLRSCGWRRITHQLARYTLPWSTSERSWVFLLWGFYKTLFYFEVFLRQGTKSAGIIRRQKSTHWPNWKFSIIFWCSLIKSNERYNSKMSTTSQHLLLIGHVLLFLGLHMPAKTIIEEANAKNCQIWKQPPDMTTVKLGTKGQYHRHNQTSTLGKCTPNVSKISSRCRRQS